MQEIALKPTDIDKSVRFNREKRRSVSYTVPLAKTSHDGGELHVGAFVKTDNGNRYTVVDFRGDYAVVVPVSHPMAAYTCHVDKLTVVHPRFDD